MFDISFFKNCHDIKKRIVSGNGGMDREEIYRTFDKFRARQPFVFNVETTNACNMKCAMCPRPNLMTRKVQHMDMGLFEKIIAQARPHSESYLTDFWKFVVDEYGIQPQDCTENAFYFYTVSKSLILHGYGDPPLDPQLIERIKICSKYNVPTYFSCVPANIEVDKCIEMMKAGAGHIKFAIDALDDETSKKIRGERNNFTDSYRKIMELIAAKKKDSSLKTTIVITMLQMSDTNESAQMQRNFMKLWADKPVYAYVKSQDNRWYYEEKSALASKAHYETQYCEFPWYSLTVMADGSVVPCTQDYNAEMTFGNARESSLADIWNGPKYEQFRKWHINGDFPQGYKCVGRCDQKLVCDRLQGGK